MRTKAEADAWLASVVTDVARGEGIDPDAGKVLFRDYAKQWMAGKADLAPKTVELYQYLLDRLILTSLGDLALTAIPDAGAGVARRTSAGGQARGSRRLPRRTGCSGILSTAVVDSMVARNPCVVKGAGVERATEILAAQPAEVSAVAAAIDPRYRALVLTAAYAGCRWDTAAQLDGLLDHGQTSIIKVEIALPQPGQPTDAGRRVVHLPGDVCRGAPGTS